MSDARKERMVREALGGSHIDGAVPERTIRNVAITAFVVLVAVAFTPSREAARSSRAR
jgi:hypothetical protein